MRAGCMAGAAAAKELIALLAARTLRTLEIGHFDSPTAFETRNFAPPAPCRNAARRSDQVVCPFVANVEIRIPARIHLA